MNTGSFPPPKRSGLILFGALIVALSAAAVWAFLNLSRAPVGPTIIIYLIVFLATLLPLPFFGYRLFSLLRADYVLDRDSLSFIWGLRVEDIPLTDIEWIRPATDLSSPLHTPTLSLPGGILGVRRHADLGPVEFIASTRHDLLLVATAKRTYAISPERAADFLATFRRATELGSLLPAESISQYPSFLLARAWENLAARFLWISGLLINLGLVAWVTFLIPSVTRVTLGFDPTGAALEPVPSVRLILLPLLSASLFVAGFFTGLFFYREEKQQPLAVIVWISSTVSSLLFLLAVLFIVTTPI
ncbi:MAG: hypothetical protein HFACDABA_03026 [Anaerolineales bacterium]|nr:hypothetical protein [Anaerolineales bacterium]